MARCAELEAELAELRAAYDLYFQGVERIPPQKKHDAFKKALKALKSSFVRQTAAKFRIESITQKLQTYERLWERTLKEIESGTYRRDLARIKRRHGDDKKKQDDDAFHIDEDLDVSDLDEGGDDLESAIAAAEAAVSKAAAPPPAVKPAVPAVAPAIAPSIAPAVTPAITPVTPPGGLKPATGVQAALKPATPTIAPAASPPAPSLKITAAAPVTAKPATGVAPSIAPAVTGSNPALKPASTGVQAALKPAGATGAQPALKPGTGVQPGLKPAGATGANPALRPPGATGSNPALVRPAAAGPDGGLSDAKIKAIFDAYVMAKKRCGEDTRAVTLDSVSATLKKQVPELMKTHKAKSVEFKVVIKDGKAVLRALPKEE